MRVGLLAAVIAAGCGRLGFDPRDPRVDATPNSADAMSDVPFGTGPFGPAAPVTELTSAGIDDNPALTGDQLEIYFTSNRAGTMGPRDIWFATRASVGDPWGTPTDPIELNSGADDSAPEPSRDGLTMLLSSDRNGNYDVYVTTRATRGDLWSTPILVPELDTIDREGGMALTADQLTVYLTRGPLGAQELYLATRTSIADVWSTPALITELSDPGVDVDPTISADQLTIYWGSFRTGNEDIWTASRSSIAGPFAGADHVPELSTAMDETDPWLSPDGHTIYFTRGVSPSGPETIYMATR